MTPNQRAANYRRACAAAVRHQKSPPPLLPLLGDLATFTNKNPKETET